MKLFEQRKRNRQDQRLVVVANRHFRTWQTLEHLHDPSLSARRQFTPFRKNRPSQADGIPFTHGTSASARSCVDRRTQRAKDGATRRCLPRLSACHPIFPRLRLDPEANLVARAANARPTRPQDSWRNTRSHTALRRRSALEHGLTGNAHRQPEHPRSAPCAQLAKCFTVLHRRRQAVVEE